MTKKELLEAYRERVIELEDLRCQLRRIGTDGRPAGVHAVQYDRIYGTNDPAAAAMHLADGLETLAQRKEEELLMMAGAVNALLQQIEDFRTYMVVLRYYLQAETDEQIAAALTMSRSRVTQMRRQYMKESA